MVHGAERASLPTMMWSLTKIVSKPTSSAFFAAVMIALGEASKPR